MRGFAACHFAATALLPSLGTLACGKDGDQGTTEGGATRANDGRKHDADTGDADTGDAGGADATMGDGGGTNNGAGGTADHENSVDFEDLVTEVCAISRVRDCGIDCIASRRNERDGFPDCRNEFVESLRCEATLPAEAFECQDGTTRPLSDCGNEAKAHVRYLEESWLADDRASFSACQQVQVGWWEAYSTRFRIHDP